MNTLPAKTPHKFFSIARVLAIASNTLLELVRLKVFYFLLIFAVLIMAVFGFSALLDMPFQGQFQMLKNVSLGAMSIFTILLAMIATANMLPKDIEDRTLYTILAKPVPRFEYLMGKLMGMFLLLLVSTLIMSLMFVVALYVKEELLITSSKAGYGQSPEWPSILRDIKTHAFSVSLVPCIATIYLASILMATLTMLISTFSTSYIFTLFISFTCYFIGSVEATARDYMLTTNPGAGARSFLQLVCLVFPDLQLFNFIDEIVAGSSIPMALFLKTAGLGFSYVFVYSLVAYVIFSFKEL